MFFYIKKPSFLNFSKQEYKDEQVKKFTVTQKKSVTNTKLIIYEDGSMYLKNGSQYFKLSKSELKNKNYVAKVDSDTLKIENCIGAKHFIQKL